MLFLNSFILALVLWYINASLAERMCELEASSSSMLPGWWEEEEVVYRTSSLREATSSLSQKNRNRRCLFLGV